MLSKHDALPKMEKVARRLTDLKAIDRAHRPRVPPDHVIQPEQSEVITNPKPVQAVPKPMSDVTKQQKQSKMDPRPS